MDTTKAAGVGRGSPAGGEATFYLSIGRLLGLRDETRSEVDLARSVERGIPARSVERMQEQLGLEDEEVYRLIVPRRTLSRRLASRSALSAEESDHAVRVARVMALARRVFVGNPQYAQTWLREAKQAFDGRTPLDVIATGPGARAVEELLLGIEHGMFA